MSDDICGDYDGRLISDINFTRVEGVDCNKPSLLIAVYFQEGSIYTEEDIAEDDLGEGKDKYKHLIGLTSLFDDSSFIHSCCKEHVGEQIKTLAEFADEFGLDSPDIIVDLEGNIQKELTLEILSKYSNIQLSEKYFEKKSCSNDQETIEEFWNHEKWRWF